MRKVYNINAKYRSSLSKKEFINHHRSTRTNILHVSCQFFSITFLKGKKRTPSSYFLSFFEKVLIWLLFNLWWCYINLTCSENALAWYIAIKGIDWVWTPNRGNPYADCWFCYLPAYVVLTGKTLETQGSALGNWAIKGSDRNSYYHW